MADYIQLLENTVAEVRDMARNHQDGRATEDVANATFTFTEGWFRNSGIYDLDRDDGRVMYAEDGDILPVHAQERVMWWFCEEKNCNVSKSQVAGQCEKAIETLEMLDMIDEQLEAGVDDAKRRELQQAAISGSHGKNTLPDAIEAANKDAQDRAIYGKCATEALQDVESNSIGCVVTDPPYGVDYTSHRENGRNDFPDGHKETLLLLDDVFQELERVCKENAHIYIFAPWNTGIPELADEYFDVAEMPLIWTKNNHVPTRDRENGFEKMYAPKYQMIWVCRMPKGDERSLRPPDSVNDNVFNYARPSETWHDTQKPVALLKDLITNSTGEGETILDPFAGSGSTLIAAADTGRHYIGIEQDDSYEGRLIREIREVKQ